MLKIIGSFIRVILFLFKAIIIIIGGLSLLSLVTILTASFLGELLYYSNLQNFLIYLGLDTYFFRRLAIIAIATIWLFFFLLWWKNYNKKLERLKLLTPEQRRAEIEAKILIRKKAQERWERKLQMWYFRYPIAVICIIFAFLIVGKNFYITLLLLFFAAVFAFEITRLVFIIFLFCMIFLSAAQLSPSAAIIVGSLIIAMAILLTLRR